MVKKNFFYEASIIVMNKNRVQLLQECLKSIKENTKDINYELIIVDALSSDDDKVVESGEECRGSRNYLYERWIDKAVVIFEKDNTSYAASNNRAMRWAYGKYVYLLNNDCRVHPNWLRSAIDFMEADKQIGHTASLVMWPHQKIMSHGANLDAKGNTIVPFGGKSMIEARHVGNYAYAGFGLYRRDVLEQVGYLPEFNVPIYWDDTSYSLDVWRLGLDVRYCPDSVITHVLYHSDRQHHRELKALENGRKEFMALWGDFLEKNDGFAPTYPYTGVRPWRNGEK